MSPYLLLGGSVAWAASVAGAFFYGQGIGEDRETAARAREDQVAAIATEAAASAAAHAISRLEVKHTTVRQTLEKEVHEKTVYRDCRSGPDAVRVFNSTIPADPAASAVGGQLPTADAAGR